MITPDVRLLSYNIRHGGLGRETRLDAVIRHCDPDIVVLQEASEPHVVERLAASTGMRVWAALPRHSVAFMSRLDVAQYLWHRPAFSRRAFLEIVLAGTDFRVFGVHLTAVHSNWTERLRARELGSLLASIARHQHGAHLVAGDFNTLAPGEQLDSSRLPPRLQWIVWLTGGKIRWQTIQMMLEAKYLDAYRHLHPDHAGPTFPTGDPHIRLDYVFVRAADVARLTGARVVDDAPDVLHASDHFPLLIEYAVQ